MNVDTRTCRHDNVRAVDNTVKTTRRSNMSTSIVARGPRSTRRFSSVRAAARALSGTGTDATERTRSAIRRVLNAGGGRVGSVRVSVR